MFFGRDALDYSAGDAFPGQEQVAAASIDLCAALFEETYTVAADGFNFRYWRPNESSWERGDRVVLYDRMRDRVLDQDGVQARYGVAPPSIPDWLALVGDAADGIPGIPRWGAKSSSALLSRYLHIEHIIAVVIYGVVLAGNIWLWSLWQNRGKAADDASAPARSAFGRPLVREGGA